MTEASFRQQAESYRKLAAAESNPALRDQLLGLARQYDGLASMMEDEPDPPPSSGASQQQPIQQQQFKKKTDET